MLVRYQEVLPKLEPRVSASRMNAIASKLRLVMPAGLATYETTLFEPLLPTQTAQFLPAALNVAPVLEPTGWIEPVWFNQIMTSVSWTPLTLVSALIQMSYAAS